MAGGAGVAEALLVSLGGIGRDRHDRHGLQRLVGLQLLDELQPADMRHLDIHDDEIGLEIAGLFHGVAAVPYRLRLIAVGPKQVAEELQRSEEHTSELQSLMRNSYAVFCLKKNK